MNNKFLIELKLYIDKHKVDNLIVKEATINQDYIMPMKSFRQEDKSKENIDSSECYITRLDEEKLMDYVNNKKSEETFSTILLKYIDKTGLSDAKIYKRAGLDRRHFSKIRCDKEYQPKKVTVLALCIALELNLEETNELLQAAGYTLTNSDTGDLVVKFCIERKIYDLIEVNEALGYFGEKMLGVTG
ncbi:MAG: hypothetical protein GX321_04555 [Clostridiales bacterium]|nr:hypothetical protein [Clostridiales bacterium]